MLVIIGTLLGTTIGALKAKRRKGRLADILQYAFVYGVIFTILGLFMTLILHRMAT